VQERYDVKGGEEKTNTAAERKANRESSGRKN
jgi:hypothetical protein